MTAHIIYGTDFKRSNPKSDRAFWIGQNEEIIERMNGLPLVRYDGPRDPSNPNVPDPLEQMAVEIVNQIFPEMDTAPAEFDVAKE